MVFRFPFYSNPQDDREDDNKEEAVLRVLHRIPFVKSAKVNRDNLREPLYVEVLSGHSKLSGRSVKEIQEGLQGVLQRIYDVKSCL